MIYVTEIYTDKGQLAAKVAKCDHNAKWLVWSWREIVAGIVIAILVGSQLVIRWNETRKSDVSQSHKMRDLLWFRGDHR